MTFRQLKKRVVLADAQTRARFDMGIGVLFLSKAATMLRDVTDGARQNQETLIGASDQRAASWAGFVSRSAASRTASIGKGRRLKSMMSINEDMVGLLW